MDLRSEQFLRRLYDATGGDPYADAFVGDIGAALGWEAETVERVALALHDDGLVFFPVLSAGRVNITEAGAWMARPAQRGPGNRTQGSLGAGASGR